ncbi:MAG: glucose/sorbosone dehydrogenase [Candidatus Paceibacterota bacterium]
MKKTLSVVLLVAIAIIIVIIFKTDTVEVINNTEDTSPSSSQTETETSEQAVTTGLSKEDTTLTLTPQTVTFASGDTATLRLPEQFEISVVAENLGKARFMTMSPDNRLFVPDMVDYNLSREGRVLIFENFNEETATFETQTTYLDNLRGPNNVEFYTDAQGNDWLYLTLTEHLVRYPYRAGDTEPSGEPEIIYSFPNEQTEGAEGVVWHITRTIHFHNDTLYVSIGSGCNSCEENPNEDRAVILAMDPDGENARTFAEGIKNGVGIAVVNGTLYATDNGTDHLGDDAPSDLMFAVTENTHYGWPYCYEVNGTKYEDNSQPWIRKNIDCENVPIAFTSFDPHSAPLGFEYFDHPDTHGTLKNFFLVALQGSWNPEIGTGYQLVRVSEEGEKEVFMDGFITTEGERIGRPVDVLEYTPHSFFVTDDFNGRMYFVSTRKL